MLNPPSGEGVVVAFDYDSLSRAVAKQVRSAAERIRQKVKKTLDDIMEVGTDLLDVKASLEHGRFGSWLQAEFGWTVRTAQHFMAVAEQFGPKNEIISHLAFQPTAAYLLAAPSVPDQARQLAIERAEAGERITTKVAREMLGTGAEEAGDRAEAFAGEVHGPPAAQHFGVVQGALAAGRAGGAGSRAAQVRSRTGSGAEERCARQRRSMIGPMRDQAETAAEVQQPS